METDLTRQLEELFHEVGEARHKVYIETDGADPEWLALTTFESLQAGETSPR